jgi:hypothetical protein
MERMKKKSLMILMAAALAFLCLSSCDPILRALGLKDSGETAGMDAATFDDSVYLETQGGQKVYNGDAIALTFHSYMYSQFPFTAMTSVMIVNGSKAPLTLSGSPAVSALGDWVVTSAATAPNPDIAFGAPSTTALDFDTSPTFDLTFTLDAGTILDLFRRRYAIDMVDAAGTHHSFEFDVEAMLSS